MQAVVLIDWVSSHCLFFFYAHQVNWDYIHIKSIVDHFVKVVVQQPLSKGLHQLLLADSNSVYDQEHALLLRGREGVMQLLLVLQQSMVVDKDHSWSTIVLWSVPAVPLSNSISIPVRLYQKRQLSWKATFRKKLSRSWLKMWWMWKQLLLLLQVWITIEIVK